MPKTTAPRPGHEFGVLHILTAHRGDVRCGGRSHGRLRAAGCRVGARATRRLDRGLQHPGAPLSARDAEPGRVAGGNYSKLLAVSSPIGEHSNRASRRVCGVLWPPNATAARFRAALAESLDDK